MRTNVFIDDELIGAARQATGLKTKKETVEAGLKLLIRVKAQSSIRKFKGKIKWEGDLESMRRD